MGLEYSTVVFWERIPYMPWAVDIQVLLDLENFLLTTIGLR